MTSSDCHLWGDTVFINKAKNGRNNFCGVNIAVFRKKMGISQRELADRLQIHGLDVDKNAIQRIECGKRFVTDVELIALSEVLGRSYDELLDKGE